jgi:hypothetical protein
VTREPGRRYKYRIKANIENMLIGVKRQPNLRCCGNAPALVRRDRPFRVRKLRPRFTSTNIKSFRRRVIRSISPSGDFQRRARIRKPFAMSSAAAQVSADVPARNAI